MLNYLATQDESKCCGCGACVEICPQKALSMKPNKEEFQYPALDANRCVDCKLCEKVCPEMNPPQKAEPLDIYALQSKNAEELFESSSGGAFRLVADSVIQQGGAVVGCVWNEKMEPVLTIADSLDGLRPHARKQVLVQQYRAHLQPDKETSGCGKNGSVYRYTVPVRWSAQLSAKSL